jgi:hypothetical protein
MKIFKKSRSLLEVSYLYYFYLKRDKSLTKGVYSRAFGKEKKKWRKIKVLFLKFTRKYP